jgi:hypothetical protein
MGDIGSAIARMEARLEARLRAIRLIRGFLREDPGFAADLRHALAEESAAVPTVTPPANPLAKGKHIERVRRFFASNGNEWTTAPDIGRAVGIKRGCVAALLYQTCKDDFEHMPHPNHSRMKLWRLKQPASEAGETKGGEP